MAALNQSYDGIIIGAGQHGLVLGAYLARAGLKILLVDRRLTYGGGLCTPSVFRSATLNHLHYIASKGALAGMTGSMARELGPDCITVNAIMPGATFTEIERKTVSPEQKVRIIAQQRIPRAETPDDLVGTLLFLSSDSAAFLIGQCLMADGGATHR